jgi:hypothetical protein
MSETKRVPQRGDRVTILAPSEGIYQITNVSKKMNVVDLQMTIAPHHKKLDVPWDSLVYLEKEDFSQTAAIGKDPKKLGIIRHN